MWSTLRWSTIRNFSEGKVLSIGPFKKVQCEVIYFLHAFMQLKEMKNRRKLPKNCNIDGINCEIFGLHNFWTAIKRSILDVLNSNCWTLFGSEIEVGGTWPLAPSVAVPLLNSYYIILHNSHCLHISFCLHNSYDKINF